MAQPRDEHGQFAPKHGVNKQLYSFRLPNETIENLDAIAQALCISRTNVIEILPTRSYIKEQVLAIIDEFIEYRCSEYGKNNAQKGEFSTDGTRWYYLKEFCLLYTSPSPRDS